MQLDVTAPAVVGGEVEDDAHAVHGLLRKLAFFEVAPDELDPPRIDVFFDVLQLAA